jgi:hypothetical protein
MKKQTIYLILLVVFIFAVAGLIIFWILNSYGVFEEPEGIIGELPEVEEELVVPTLPVQPTIEPEQREKLRVIAKGDILGFWNSGPNAVQYFKRGSGLWEADYVNPQIEERNIDLGITFGNVIELKPSVEGNVLIKYVLEGSENFSYSIIDIVNRTLKNLNQNIVFAEWSPDGKDLVFYYSDSPIYHREGEDNQYLGIIDKNLRDERVLFNLNSANDIILSWPTSSKIFITQKPSAFAKQDIISFDFNDRKFEKNFSANGLILDWSHFGNYGLLFSTDNNGFSPILKLINKDFISLATFPKITLPEKCVFSRIDSILYCSVFENGIPSSVLWPDDYYQGTFSTGESIYRINIQSMEAEIVLEQPIFEIRGMELSLDENNLIFYDKNSQSLYVLNME